MSEKQKEVLKLAESKLAEMIVRNQVARGVRIDWKKRDAEMAARHV